MSRRGSKSAENSVERDKENGECSTRARSSETIYSPFRDTDYDNARKKRKIVSEVEYLSDSSTDVEITVTGIKSPESKPDVSISQTTESDSLYGLNPDFLQYLGIKLPLDKWIHVTNFRCDKIELKEVLELAGRVLMCSVIAIRERYAKVMYSHPLEAVQAVSMLNGQTFYGQQLKIIMIPPPTDTVILPKGLAMIGPGLGINGKPLTDIAKQYKKFTKLQESLLDTAIFSHDDHRQQTSSNSDSKKKKIKKDSDSEITDDEKPFDKRIMSFKVKSVEELQNPVSIKIEVDAVSPIEKQARTDQRPRASSESEQLTPMNLQIRSALNNSSVRPQKALNPIPTIGPTVPSVQQRPHLRPRGINQSSAPSGFMGSQSVPPVNVHRPPGINMGATVSPIMPVRPMGPMAPMGPVGNNMNPGRPSGMMMNTGTGVTHPIGPGMGGPGPIRINRSMPGSSGMNGPGGFSLPRVATLLQTGFGPSPLPRPRGPVPPSELIAMEVSNLPPSTTFTQISEKLSRYGQVMSLELTTPGCAIAKFAQRMHVDRCLQIFNGLNLNGYITQARVLN